MLSYCFKSLLKCLGQTDELRSFLAFYSVTWNLLLTINNIFLFVILPLRFVLVENVLQSSLSQFCSDLSFLLNTLSLTFDPHQTIYQKYLNIFCVKKRETSYLLPMDTASSSRWRRPLVCTVLRSSPAGTVGRHRSQQRLRMAPGKHLNSQNIKPRTYTYSPQHHVCFPASNFLPPPFL